MDNDQAIGIYQPFRAINRATMTQNSWQMDLLEPSSSDMSALLEECLGSPVPAVTVVAEVAPHTNCIVDAVVLGFRYLDHTLENRGESYDF